jgi:hypothetical protein
MTAEILAGFQAQAGAGSDGAEVDASSGLHLAIGRLATILEQQRRSEERMYEAIFAKVLRPTTVTVAGGVASLLGTGPETGFAWAVQRITVAGLATADVVSLYRGPGVAAAQTTDNLLTIVTGTAPTWHPGRTGLILQEGERVTIAGTGLTATQVTLTGEVIQMEQWLLPHFLL